MSIRETVIEAVMALLNGAGKPGGVPTIQRGYLMAVDASMLPLVSVFPIADDAEVQFAGNMPSVTLHTMSLRVVVFAKSTSTDPPDKVLEPILSWIVKATSGQRATGNTGPYHLIYEDEVAWDYEQVDHGYVRANVTLGVKYQTSVSNPDSWA